MNIYSNEKADEKVKLRLSGIQGWEAQRCAAYLPSRYRDN